MIIIRFIAINAKHMDINNKLYNSEDYLWTTGLLLLYCTYKWINNNYSNEEQDSKTAVLGISCPSTTKIKTRESAS